VVRRRELRIAASFGLLLVAFVDADVKVADASNERSPPACSDSQVIRERYNKVDSGAP